MYRVAMTDSVQGNKFTFAIVYPARTANEAGKLAMNEWALPIVSTRQVF